NPVTVLHSASATAPDKVPLNNLKRQTDAEFPSTHRSIIKVLSLSKMRMNLAIFVCIWLRGPIVDSLCVERA
ncbi:hypothetical protein, partial [Pseudomonas aeruginosa]